MLNYLKNSFKRKIARRVTKEYPTYIDTFQVEGIRTVKYANWDNPLVGEKKIEIESIEFFRKFLSEGDTAIDIGANVGAVSIHMSLAAGTKGLVIGFDPNPYVFKILEQNISLNPDLTNIETHNLAISETEDEFFYHSSEASFNNGGISKESKSRNGKYAIPHKIKGVNLEEFLEKNYSERLDRLKLIKIDTEGYDKEIIRSITSLLQKYKPTVISECFKHNSPEDRFEQFNLLKDLGYSIYHFDDFKKDAVVTPLQVKEDMLKWKHFDIYAVFE